MAEESNNAPEAAADGAQQGPQFALQRIYLKDTSFRIAEKPQIFQTQWSPKINFDIKTRNTKVADDVYEVVLVLTAEAQLEEETAFVVEVHQAGIFTVKEFSETDLEQVLATVCPSILFPTHGVARRAGGQGQFSSADDCPDQLRSALRAAEAGGRAAGAAARPHRRACSKLRFRQ